MKKTLILLLILLCLLTACTPSAPVGDLTVSVTVDCLSTLETPELVPPEKAKLLPEDGILLKTQANFSQGENAYDVLLRTLQAEKIHYEVDATRYFVAIGNLYGGECGNYSGWLYTVNGESPNVGAADYLLSDGDELRFYYVTTMA